MNSENRADRKSLHSRIYEVIDQVPAGRVATYGQIAQIVGCGARVVGYALASLPIGRPLCWHRIVNARGEISLRSSGDTHSRQRSLLSKEGVHFDLKRRIDLTEFRWQGPGWLWLEQNGYEPGDF